MAGEIVSWSGRCRDGRAHGRGVAVWFAAGELTGRYHGWARDGRPHGLGVYEDRVAGGYDRYVGEFERGLRHGRGSLRLASGERYDGGFAEGLPDGWGIWRRRDGSRLDGEFVAGRGSQVIASEHRSAPGQSVAIEGGLMELASLIGSECRAQRIAHQLGSAQLLGSFRECDEGGLSTTRNELVGKARYRVLLMHK